MTVPLDHRSEAAIGRVRRRRASQAAADVDAARLVAVATDRADAPDDPEPPDDRWRPGREDDDYPLSDLGNADRLLAAHGEDLLNVANIGWHLWDGHRWAEDPLGRVVSMGGRLLEDTMLNAARCGRRKLARFALSSQSASRIRAMVDLAGTDPRAGLEVRALDRDPWAFNVANGTLDLRSGELSPHRRGDFITKMAPVDYDPAAEAPRWLAFLEQVFDGDLDLIGYLQRAVGYSMVGEVHDQHLFIAFGDGANGKTTFLDVLLRMFGDYGGTIPIDELLDQTWRGHATYREQLRGRRLVTTSEPGARRRLSEAAVKQLTGADPIIANRMRRDPVTFWPSHTLWMAGNHRPRVAGGDLGIWRRLRVIPFGVTIDDVERIPNLAVQLVEEELPGVLRWAVEGVLEWRASGLGSPAAVAEAVESYREAEDVLRAFLDDRCHLDEHAEVSGFDLYRAYRAWCEDNGQRPMRSQDWAVELPRYGITRVLDAGKRGPRKWKGCYVVPQTI